MRKSPPIAPHDQLGPAVIVAPLGANPAPLLQLVWALHRYWKLSARRIFVVVDARGYRYLHAEALDPGAAWDKLRRVLGSTAIEASQVEVVAVRTAAGELLPGDEAPEDAASYNEAAWSAARRAIAEAGADPVIFALVAGRRRTMHVAATVLFQLLARPQDRLVDVRETDHQSSRSSGRSAGKDPASLDVVLVDVQVPRLRSLLRERDLLTYAAALRAGQAAVDASVSSRLVLDFPEGKAFVGDEELPLSKAQFVWYATLAQHRRSEPGKEGWLKVRDIRPLWRMARSCSQFAWSAVVQGELVEKLMSLQSPPVELKELDDDNLRKMRADTVKRIRKWSAGRPRDVAAMIIPSRKKLSTGHVQRIALAPDRIEFIGAPEP